MTTDNGTDTKRRAALAFYCIGTLDLLGTLETAASDFERTNWGAWYWELQTSMCTRVSHRERLSWNNRL